MNKISKYCIWRNALEDCTCNSNLSWKRARSRGSHWTGIIKPVGKNYFNNPRQVHKSGVLKRSPPVNKLPVQRIQHPCAPARWKDVGTIRDVIVILTSRSWIHPNQTEIQKNVLPRKGQPLDRSSFSSHLDRKTVANSGSKLFKSCGHASQDGSSPPWALNTYELRLKLFWKRGKKLEPHFWFEKSSDHIKNRFLSLNC